MRWLMLLLLLSSGLVNVSAQDTEFALYASPDREVAFFYPSEWNVEWDGRFATITNTAVFDQDDPNSIQVTINGGEADQTLEDFAFGLANRLRAGVTSNEQTTTAEGFPVFIGRYDAAPIQFAIFGVIMEQVSVESLRPSDRVDTMTLQFRGMYNILDSYQSEIQYMVDTLYQASVDAANASPLPDSPSLLDLIPDVSSVPITPQTARSLVGDSQIDFRSRVFAYNPDYGLVLNISPISELVSVYRAGVHEPLVQFPYDEFDGSAFAGMTSINGRITSDGTRLILVTDLFFYIYDLTQQQMTSVSHDVQNVAAMSAKIDAAGTLVAFYSPSSASVEILTVADGSVYGSLSVQGVVENLEFSPNSRFLAIDQMVNQQGRVLIWDTVLRTSVGSILVDLPTRYSGFSPDGRYYAFSTGRTLRVWDSTTGLMITIDSPIPQTPQDGGRRMPFGFSSDSRFITYGVPNGSIEVFDLEAGESTRSIPAAHDGLIGAIAFNNAGTLIASARQITEGIERDFELRLWDVETGTLAHELMVDFGSIMNIQTMIFGSGDQELLLVATENNDFYYRRFFVSP